MKDMIIKSVLHTILKVFDSITVFCDFFFHAMQCSSDFCQGG